MPFFILGGNLMNTTGITERLLRFAALALVPALVLLLPNWLM